MSRGLAPTRARARDLIQRGYVALGGVVIVKPAAMVAAGDEVAIAGDAPAYVSRGAEKLIAALDAFAFSPAGRCALDIGASTGGFTEVLIERGASRVYAVDVGHGQIHSRLKADAKVVVMEGTDARSIDALSVPAPITAVVADVSFISLTKALPAALRLVQNGAWLVALVKPQFEVGVKQIGKGGIVRDTGVQKQVVDDIEVWLGLQPGWSVAGVIPSPILGGSGNAEFLIGATFAG